MGNSTSSGGAGDDCSSSSVDLRKLLVSFRERFDPLYPVILRRASIGDAWGDTAVVLRKGEPHLLIRVEKGLSPEAQFFVVMHELGHCLQWRANEGSREDDHDAEFGLAYAKLWSTLIGSG